MRDIVKMVLGVAIISAAVSLLIITGNWNWLWLLVALGVIA